LNARNAGEQLVEKVSSQVRTRRGDGKKTITRKGSVGCNFMRRSGSHLRGWREFRTRAMPQGENGWSVERAKDHVYEELEYKKLFGLNKNENNKRVPEAFLCPLPC
jgi:hypothetical protein